MPRTTGVQRQVVASLQRVKSQRSLSEQFVKNRNELGIARSHMSKPSLIKNYGTVP